MRSHQNNRHPTPPPPLRSPQPPDSTMRPNHRPPQPPPPAAIPSPRPPNSTERSNNQPRQPPPPPEPEPEPQPEPEQQPQPTFAEYPPYIMPPPPRRRRSGGSSCASCMLATAFLLIIAAIAVTACFVLFKPQDPKIAVDSVRFPAFSLSNGTIDFTIYQYVAVRNPNRYSFSHYDSSLQLFYSGIQLGFMFIPAGEIAPGRTQYVSATFNVKSIPVTNQLSTTTAAVSGSDGAMFGPGPTMEVETSVKMAGRVRVLKVLAHHVETRVKCRVTIEVSNGNVLGFHC